MVRISVDSVKDMLQLHVRMYVYDECVCAHTDTHRHIPGQDVFPTGVSGRCVGEHWSGRVFAG